METTTDADAEDPLSQTATTLTTLTTTANSLSSSSNTSASSSTTTLATESVEATDQSVGTNDDEAESKEAAAAVDIGIVDVAESLQERFILLTGGRDRQGRWLVTLPETSRPDPDLTSFCRLAAYLVDVASIAEADEAAGKAGTEDHDENLELTLAVTPQFFLVIDRRRSSWPRVLSCVELILAGFPPPVRLSGLLILRPSGVLAGITRSHYVSKLDSLLGGGSRGRANCYPATSICDDTDQLTSVVSPEDLCPDLGGHLAYCHDQWIERRAAVESYARHAGSIVAAAATCSARLAGEALSDRLTELMAQMRQQEAMKDEMLEDLQSAKEHGETLVSNIERRAETQGDRFSDSVAVRRVLRRIADSESAFNRAWTERRQGPVARHLAAVMLTEEATRVTTALKERMADPPEADTKEAERLLSEARSLIGKTVAIERPDLASQIGEVCHQAESDTERRRQMQRRNAELAELARRTEDWASIGMDILGRSDVGVDELNDLLRRQPSLSNLDTLSDLMAPPALRTKLATLASRAQTLGATLARQRDDLMLCRLQLASPLPDDDGSGLSDNSTPTMRAANVEEASVGEALAANSASEMVALSTADGGTLKRRNPALRELIETERRYVEDLQRVWDVVSSDEAPPAELAGDACELLANWPDLLAFHRDQLLPDLLAARSEADVADCFQRHCDGLHVYQQYCLNKPAADSLLARLGRNHPFLQRCETLLHLSDEASGGSAPLPLGAYLLKPVQRVQKYQLLLAEMQRACPEQRAALGRAVESLLAALSVLNDSMALAEVEGLRRAVLNDLGRVLLHGDFQVIEDGKLLSSNKTRRVYLFSCGLLVCKRIPGQQQPVRFTPVLVIRVSEMGLNQQPVARLSSSEKRRFQVTLKHQAAPLTLQAANGAVKALWVAEIERVLWSHFTSLKAEAVKRQQQRQQQLQQELLQQQASMDEEADAGAFDGLEALADFASQDAAMLPLRKGEFLLAINTDSENYWLVENRECRRGYAHRQYLRPVRQISGGSSASSSVASAASGGSPAPVGANGMPRRGSMVTTAV